MTAGFITSPCRGCGADIVFATVEGKNTPLDLRPPVYVFESDGEGGGAWLRMPKGVVAVSHFSTCPKANDFNGRVRGQGGG